MRIAATSDVHGAFGDCLNWPGADILVVTGDFLPNFHNKKAMDGQLQLEYLKGPFQDIKEELLSVYTNIVFIAGNHDIAFETDAGLAVGCLEILADDRITYLNGETQTIMGRLFWGSPWTPEFFSQRWAFNFLDHRNPNTKDAAKRQAEREWSKIPSNVDVLLTHSPPFGILDKTADGRHVGCPHLLSRLENVQPTLHVFGHIHESYGVERRGGTIVVNASRMNLKYKPVNDIVVFDI
jgi:Icc-related predicted phosphoesterase